jgi:two-component system CheB/CheR fusion protein
MLSERDLFDTLVQVVRALGTAEHLHDVTAAIRRAARCLTDADGVTVVLRDGDQCHYVDEDAVAPLWKGKRFPASSCVSGWVMARGEAAAIPDIYADARVLHDAYRPTFVKSLALVPVGSPAIAAIGAYWATLHEPSPYELRILRALADTAFLGLARIRDRDALISTSATTVSRVRNRAPERRGRNPAASR